MWAMCAPFVNYICKIIEFTVCFFLEFISTEIINVENLNGVITIINRVDQFSRSKCVTLHYILVNLLELK